MALFLHILAMAISAEAWAYECDAPAPLREMSPAAALEWRDSSGVEQAVGFYSEGSLQYPEEIPSMGRGFLKLFLPRNRAWTTGALRSVLEEVALRLSLEFPSRDALQIGDIAGERGGMISGHSSHQNGLDADLAYFRSDQTMQDPGSTYGFSETFVQKGSVTGNFDRRRNWALVKALASTGRVNRFFVNPVIKEEFCRYARAVGEYSEDSVPLGLLRSWQGHDGHIHVRLRCPDGARLCRDQDPPPPGAGCL